MGVKIKDAQLVEQVTGNEKIPVSDGSGSPKAVTTEQLKDYIGVNEGDSNVQSDWNETDPTSDAFIKNKPTIPNEVTKQTVEGWGFTKNTGDYNKPVNGIPKSDLDSNVQDSLNKANSALQEHQDISNLATKTELNKKQDTISDLSTIRANAEKGATALQSVPSEYVTETELSGKGYATTSALSSGLSGKVDKDGSKVLSTNDFTNALKSKLEGLSNYDDTTISNAVNKLRTDFDTLVSGDTTTAIKTFNEVIAFLDGITDTQDLESIIASIEQQIAAKQDKVLKFTNKTASSWVSDSTYADYPYRCDISCSGVTADMFAEVVFGVAQSTSGNYAPVCETKAGAVSVWSNENTTITIPTIIITK